MHLRIYVLVFLISLFNLCSTRYIPDHARNTPAPTIPGHQLQRRDKPIYLSTVTNYQSIIHNQAFVGWYEAASGQTAAFTCSSEDSVGGYQTWSTSGAYGACCPLDKPCQPATTCSGNSLSLPALSSFVECGSALKCSTMTVYYSSPTGSPVYNVFCASSNWNIWHLTHDISTSAPPTPRDTPSALPNPTTLPTTPAPPPPSSTSTPAPTRPPRKPSYFKRHEKDILIPTLIIAVIILSLLSRWLWQGYGTQVKFFVKSKIRAAINFNIRYGRSEARETYDAQRYPHF